MIKTGLSWNSSDWFLLVKIKVD